MAKAPKPYTRLPGRGGRRSVFAVVATRSSLWLGADHLLAIDATVAAESYRRFYFRDIEALVIRQTLRRTITNWVLLGLLLVTVVPCLIAWRLDGSGGWLGAAAVFGALWLIPIFANTLLGPTCETKIRTAVHFEPLPSLVRLSAARKVLARLAPLITAAQGALTPKEFTAAPWMDSPLSRFETSHPVRHDKGFLHYLLFSLLIVDALSAFLAYGVFGFSFPVPTSLSTIFSMIAALISVTAVMRQGNTDLPEPARLVAKCSLALYFLSFVAGVVFTFIFVLNHPGTPVRTGLEFVNEPGFETTAIAFGGIAAVIGLAGFVAMRAPRPPLPPA